MTGVSGRNDQGDDLEATICECEATDPGFRELVDAAYERRERAFLAKLEAAQARGIRTGTEPSATAAAADQRTRRNLSGYGMHAIEDDQRRRYHRNGTQRKRGR